jgi:CTP:molybdopterin cytidylyltransferase MocA
VRPALVVLAAGASTRLGRPKALVDLGGSSGLERLLAAGAGATAGDALVVGGAHAQELRAALAARPAGTPPAELLVNPRWREGRTGGLALAARARPGRDLLVAPADCPLVPAEVFDALARSWAERGTPALGWLSPLHTPADPGSGVPGSHGHPLLLGRELAGQLAALPPDTPLRDLRAGADPLWDVPTPCGAVLDDLDTEGDLVILRERVARGDAAGIRPH